MKGSSPIGKAPMTIVWTLLLGLVLGYVATVWTFQSLILLAIVLTVIYLETTENPPISYLALLAFGITWIPYGMSGEVALTIRVGGIPIHPLDVLYLGVMIRLLPTLRIATTDPSVRSASRWLTALIACIGVYLVIGFAYGQTLWDVARDALSFSYYLIALPLVRLPLDSQQRNKLIRAMVLGAVLHAITAICVLISPSFPVLGEVTRSYWQGATGVRIYFENTYQYLFLIPLMWVWVAKGETRGQVLFGLVGVGLFSLTALISQTRSILLLLIAAAGLFLVLGRASRRSLNVRNMFLFGVGISIALCSWFVLPDSWTGQIAERVNGLRTVVSDVSISGRLDSYALAWRQVVERNGLGTGLGTLFEVPWANQGYKDVRNQGYMPYIDNSPLVLLGKMGWIGLVFFYGLHLTMLRQTLKQVKLNRRMIASAIGVGSLLVVSVSQSLLLSSRLIIFYLIFTLIEVRQLQGTPEPRNAFKRGLFETRDSEELITPS